MITINSNIINYITVVRNCSNAVITKDEIASFIESEANETFTPYDYLSAIRQGAKTFREITASLDPFGVVDSVYLINDSLNKSIDTLVSNADNTISSIDLAIKNCNQSVLNLTSAVSTATLTVDKLAKQADTLTTELMNLTIDLVRLGDQVTEDLASLTAEITDFVLQTVDTAKNVNSNIKKMVPILLTVGIILMAVIFIFYISKKRRHHGN